MLSLAYADGRQVRVDGDIAAVAHHDTHHAGNVEDGTDLAIKDAACLCAGLTFDVQSFVVDPDAFQAVNVVLSEAVDNAIAAGDGHR